MGGRLEGKVAIVSGGAGGMGSAHARRFVAEGARVVLGDLREEDAVALASALGDAALGVRLDVTDEASWQRTLAETRRAFGPPTVLVNNAGISHHRSLLEDTRAEFERVIKTNLTGTWLGMHEIGPAMAEAGGGSIVNISSTAGLQGMADTSAYCASKWGVRGLTKAAALDLGRDGIRVNSVHPGLIDTPMARRGVAELIGFDFDDPRVYAGRAIARAAQPEEVTNLVLFLASDESSYCTGHEFVVDGGAAVGRALAARS